MTEIPISLFPWLQNPVIFYSRFQNESQGKWSQQNHNSMDEYFLLNEDKCAVMNNKITTTRLQCCIYKPLNLQSLIIHGI